MSQQTRPLPRIAVIGAGPAGLSIARFLTDNRTADITVYEAEHQVGGKCYSFAHEDLVVEFGTCYATNAHRRLLPWLKEAGMTKRLMPHQEMNGQDVMRFVRGKRPLQFYYQVARYLLLRRQLLTREIAGDVTAWKELSWPLSKWLHHHKLPAIERLMLRATTSVGYGYADQVATLHALRWVDDNLIATGALKNMWMPSGGWQKLWLSMSRNLNILLGAPVSGIERSGEGVTIIADGQPKTRFDFVVNTLPIDIFNRLVDHPTDKELFIEKSVCWSEYTCTLVAAHDWFTKSNIRIPVASNKASEKHGSIAATRYEGYSTEWAAHLYITGQNSAKIESNELTDIVRYDIELDGGTFERAIMKRTWKYFPSFDAAAIASGVTETCRQVQGANRTFHSGATFSHEAVSNIVNFNVELIKLISAHAATIEAPPPAHGRADAQHRSIT